MMELLTGAVDLRSIKRQMNQHVQNGDIQQAIDLVLEQVREFDSERDYYSSITILEDLLALEEYKEIASIKNRIISHIVIRSLLGGSKERIRTYTEPDKYDLLMSLVEAFEDSDDSQFVLESIEKQTLGGGYEVLPDIPVITFNEEDEMIGLIEDFYEDARYSISYVNKNTQLQSTVAINVGQLEDLNVVEKKRILKL